MTGHLKNRRVILCARPKGVPNADQFAVEEGSVENLSDGCFLVRNHYLSVDPAMRGWVNDAPNYLPPVVIGEVMRSFAVGEIIDSRHPDFAVGEMIVGMFGWQRYAISDGSDVMRKVGETDLPPSLALGVLGLNGITAYFGLLDICQPKPGDTVVVSTAAGAVGSSVGQIAKIKGCRTIGIAGGADKVARCTEEFGYDAAIDYKAVDDLDAALSDACPDGVDVYYDNVCGPISDAVLRHIALNGRISICGTAALTDWEPWPVGPRVHRHLLVKRARMQGFIIFDYADRYQDAVDVLAGWVRQGKLKYSEHILGGMAAAPGAIEMLYRGENQGKLLIKVD